MENSPPQPTTQPYQAPANQQASPPQERSTLAVVSLILGICSLFTWIVTGIPAIICGHIAQSKITQSGGRLKGSGMAIIGLVLGYVSIPLIFIIAALAAMATPVIMKQKMKADQVQVISQAKQIYSYLIDYEVAHGKFPDTLEDLENAELGFVAADYTPRRGNFEYHGASKSTSSPNDHILLSWHQKRPAKWVTLRIDGTTKMLTDEAYQAALRAQASP